MEDDYLHQVGIKKEPVNEVNSQLMEFHNFDERTLDPVKYEEKLRYKIDLLLKEFGLLPEPIVFYVDDVTPRQSKSKMIWNVFITALTALHAFRILWYLTLADEEESLLQFGDFTQWLGGKRYVYLIPIFIINASAALQSLCYLCSDKSEMSWLSPFAALDGLISPLEADLWNLNMFRQIYDQTKQILKFTKIINYLAWAGISIWIGVLYFTNTSLTQFLFYGFPWLLNHAAWFFYTPGIIGANVACLQVLSYYLVIRLDAISKIFADIQVRKLFSKKKAVRASVQNQYLIAIEEHKRIYLKAREFDKFWNRLIFVIYFSYIPLSNFILYQLIFAKLTLITFFLMLYVLLYSIYILVMVSVSASLVSFHNDKLYQQLNDIDVQIEDNKRKLALPLVIQRLKGIVFGFSCLNLFTITKKTIVDVSKINYINESILP